MDLEKVVSVIFSYPKCEGGGSTDFESYMPIDSMNALGNDQEFMSFLL